MKGIILVILAAGAWGMGGIAGQFLYQAYGADAVWLVMVRQIIAGFLFLLFAGFVQKQDVFKVLKDMPADIIKFSFLGILGAQLGFYYTISLCNAATATVLQYMAPVYVMVWVSFIKKQMPDGRELLGIAGALLGVFLIATHGRMDSLALSPAALGAGVLSALGYAYYTVKPVSMLKQYRTTVIIGWGQLIPGLSLMAFRSPSALVPGWDAGAAGALLYLILGATIASYALYMQGVKLIGPAKASLISCVEPLASIVAVVLMLGTKLTLMDYIGMGCIIFTVLLLSLPKK